MADAFDKFRQLEQNIGTRLAGPVVLGGNKVYQSLERLSKSIDDITRRLGQNVNILESLKKDMEYKKGQFRRQVLEKLGYDVPMFTRAEEMKKLAREKIDFFQSRLAGPGHMSPSNRANVQKKIDKWKEVETFAGQAAAQATPSEPKQFWNLIRGPVMGALAALAASALHTAGILRQGGFSVFESLRAFPGLLLDSIKGVFSGIFLGPGARAGIAAAAGKQLLQRGLTPGTERGVEQMVNIGTSPESAVKLGTQIRRITGWSRETAYAWTTTTMAIAKANNIPMAGLMEEMASNADLLANAANRTPEALSRAVVQAKRLGVEVGKFEQMADRFTSDFDTFLEAQAKLQTVVPGMDLTGLMVASQYGSTADIQKSLQEALGGRDIGQLPRSVRNMIAQSLGMSVQDLVNVAAGREPGAEMEIPKKQLDAMDIIKENTGGILKWLLRFGLIGGAASFLGNLRVLKGAGEVGGLSTLLPKAGLFGGLGATMAGAGAKIMGWLGMGAKAAGATAASAAVPGAVASTVGAIPAAAPLAAASLAPGLGPMAKFGGIGLRLGGAGLGMAGMYGSRQLSASGHQVAGAIGGLASGALAGASLGSFGGAPGALIGAGIGAGIGLISSLTAKPKVVEPTTADHEAPASIVTFSEEERTYQESQNNLMLELLRQIADGLATPTTVTVMLDGNKVGDGVYARIHQKVQSAHVQTTGGVPAPAPRR